MSKIHDFSGGMFRHAQLNASTLVKLLRLSITINFTKGEEIISVNWVIMTYHSISLCSNSNHLISLIPPKLPQILDIYSIVAL